MNSFVRNLVGGVLVASYSIGAVQAQTLPNSTLNNGASSNPYNSPIHRANPNSRQGTESERATVSWSQHCAAGAQAHSGKRWHRQRLPYAPEHATSFYYSDNRPQARQLNFQPGEPLRTSTQCIRKRSCLEKP